MKKKGFTLIELLAVIVVLAIIALIATPIVLNLINNAKEGAAKSSATAYVKAVENGVVQELVKNSNGKYTGKFKVDSTGLKLVSDADNNVKITVDVSGKLPKENSYVVLDENGTVTNAYFIIDSYNVQYSDGVANIVKIDDTKKDTILNIVSKLEAAIQNENLSSDYKNTYSCKADKSGNNMNVHCNYNGKVHQNDYCYKNNGVYYTVRTSCEGNEEEYNGKFGFFEIKDGDYVIASSISNSLATSPITVDLSGISDIPVYSYFINYDAKSKKIVTATFYYDSSFKNGYYYGDGNVVSY